MVQAVHKDRPDLKAFKAPPVSPAQLVLSVLGSKAFKAPPVSPVHRAREDLGQVHRAPPV